MSPNCRKASEEGHLRAQVLESPGSPRCLSWCPGGPAHVTFSALHPGLTGTRLPLQAFCEFRTASSLKSLFCPKTRPLLKTMVGPAWTGSARSGDPPIARHWPPQHPLSPGGGPHRSLEWKSVSTLQQRPHCLPAFPTRWRVPGGGWGVMFLVCYRPRAMPLTEGAPQTLEGIEMGET